MPCNPDRKGILVRDIINHKLEVFAYSINELVEELQYCLHKGFMSSFNYILFFYNFN